MLKDLMYANEEREDGFSLVELLVVIVIIGILTAIAVGAFMNQRKKANDASLKSDLRTTANELVSWSVDHDMYDFIEAIKPGTGTAMIVVGEGGVHQLPNTPQWNDAEGFPDIHISKGNVVEIILDRNPDASGKSNFNEGGFCLLATSPHSSYDYLPGSAKWDEYDKYLYWDAKLGGTKELSELMEIYDSGADMSCGVYVEKYRDA